MRTFPAEHVSAARAAADRAAERVGVRVEEIHGLEGEAAVSDLFDRVWGTVGCPVLPSNLLHAINHAGNYLVGAYDGERMVGAAFGFMAEREGEIYMHSHMTGVDPEVQRSGIGFALKVHQRSWGLARGLERIEWTYDPLVRHNSYFNLVKLGALITGYHENFYGAMPDGINAGDESDRVVVSWMLASERVAQACNNGLVEPDVEALRRSGAEVLLDIEEHAPVPREAAAPLLLCRIPQDIVSVRRSDAELAKRWRYALRSTLGGALRDGYVATAISRDGWYVLQKGTA